MSKMFEDRVKDLETRLKNIEIKLENLDRILRGLEAQGRIVRTIGKLGMENISLRK